MSAITFDTIEYFDELVNAGFSEKQAKAQTKALKRVVGSTLDGEISTRGDLSKVQNALTTDIKDLELKIEKRLNRLEILMSILLAVQAIPILKSLIS